MEAQFGKRVPNSCDSTKYQNNVTQFLEMEEYAVV